MSISYLGAGPNELDYGPACRTAHLQFQPAATGWAFAPSHCDAHGFLAGRRTGVGVYEFDWEDTPSTFQQARAWVQGPYGQQWAYVEVVPASRKIIVTVTDTNGDPADLSTHKVNVTLRTRQDMT